MEAILELGSIQDGDLGPNSRGVSREVLADLTLMGALPEHVHAVPTAGGNVALEWNQSGVEYTAKIIPGHLLFMCIDDDEADDVLETTASYSPTLLRQFLQTGMW